MPNQLRIIGGQWRSRQLSFAYHKQLRPTSDRLRETLFNWLQAHCNQAHCLDAFAGTGILGIEALSRGAEWITFCERSRINCRSIQNNLDQLPLQPQQNYQLLTGSCFKYFKTLTTQFDIIFLDPPFNQSHQLISQALQQIVSYQLLKPSGSIYIEQPSNKALPLTHNHNHSWSVYKQTTNGQVSAYLIKT